MTPPFITKKVNQAKTEILSALEHGKKKKTSLARVVKADKICFNHALVELEKEGKIKTNRFDVELVGEKDMESANKKRTCAKCGKEFDEGRPYSGKTLDGIYYCSPLCGDKICKQKKKIEAESVSLDADSAHKINNTNINDTTIQAESKKKSDGNMIEVEKLKDHPLNTEYLPPLTMEQFEGLKERIRKHGFSKEPVEITPDNILLDGHNRVKICRELGIKEVPFVVIEIHSDEEAERYIIEKNYYRRQLTPEQQSYLRGKIYEGEKKDQGGDRKSDEAKSSGQNVHLISPAQNLDSSKKEEEKKTAQKVAEKFGVNEKTVRRDAEFSTAVDTIRQAAPEIAQAILSRKTFEGKKISKTDAIAISEKVKQGEDAKEVAREIAEKKAAKAEEPTITGEDYPCDHCEGIPCGGERTFSCRCQVCDKWMCDALVKKEYSEKNCCSQECLEKVKAKEKAEEPTIIATCSECGQKYMNGRPAGSGEFVKPSGETGYFCSPECKAKLIPQPETKAKANAPHPDAEALQKLQQENESLRKENAELKASMSQNPSEQRDEIEKLRNENKQLKAELKTKSERFTVLLNEKCDLEDEMRRIKKPNDYPRTLELRSEIKKLNKECNGLAEENDKLRRKMICMHNEYQYIMEYRREVLARKKAEGKTVDQKYIDQVENDDTYKGILPEED